MTARDGNSTRTKAAASYDLDSHAAHLVRRTHQRATMLFQEIMQDDTTTPTQFAALGTLLERGPLSQNHLGRMTAMDPSTISVVVRKLLKRGLVHRFSSPTDQRLLMIDLTPEGRAYTIERVPLSEKVSKELLSPLSPGEVALLKELLSRVADPSSDS
jgi:DNA-binding MarR family transcriptional regulator